MIRPCSINPIWLLMGLGLCFGARCQNLNRDSAIPVGLRRLSEPSISHLGGRGSPSSSGHECFSLRRQLLAVLRPADRVISGGRVVVVCACCRGKGEVAKVGG